MGKRKASERVRGSEHEGVKVDTEEQNADREEKRN